MTGQDPNQFEVLRSPEFKRKLHFWKRQWIMIPLLFTVPVLALTKVLGDLNDTAKASVPGLEISVKYPKRIRFGQNEEIQVNLHNQSLRALQDVKIEIDQDYLSQFENVQFLPSANDYSNQVKLSTLQPGEKRQVIVNVRAKHYGMHHGQVRVSGHGTEVASAQVDSLIFP
jgi:hypothetical protein